MTTPATVENARRKGYIVKIINDGTLGLAKTTLWAVYNSDGHYLSEWLIIQNEHDDEDVFWKAESIRFEADIEHLDELSAQAKRSQAA